MVARDKLMTVAEFWQQYAGEPYELIEGRVVDVPPTGFEHGMATSRVNFVLRQFIDAHQLGEVVGAETGFQLSETTMRGVDAAFISNEKLKRITDPEKFLPFAPDLAVEVVSPGDRAGDIRQKVALYLKAGTPLVWMIYPEQREVVVHYADNTARTYGEADTLTGDDVLPGFSTSVAALFPQKSTE